MMAGAEHRAPPARPSCVRIHFLLVISLFWGGHGLAQTNAIPNAVNEPAGFSGWLGAVQEWAEENLDENLLAALGEGDQTRVETFLQQLGMELGGEYVLDLAALKEAALVILPLLEAYEETQPYGAWLRARLDYFEAAQALQAIAPAPKTPPGKTVPPPPKPTVASQRKVWTQTLAQRPLPRGADRLVPQLKAIFAREGVPGELVWLAEVESAFDRRALSPAGAAGLFQLMPATAKRFELRRWPFDQRYQVAPSARAAARYLRILHAQFKDWPLAVAAYNAGEGRVGTLLTQHKARRFDTIAPHLPAETQLYVPKVEATLRHREGVKLSALPPPQPRP